MSSDDEPTERECGEYQAKRAEEYASQVDEGMERTAVTYALLAIYHELRHNDLGAKIDALTEQVELVVTQQGSAESRISDSISDLGDVVRGRPRHR